MDKHSRELLRMFRDGEIKVPSLRERVWLFLVLICFPKESSVISPWWLSILKRKISPDCFRGIVAEMELHRAYPEQYPLREPVVAKNVRSVFSRPRIFRELLAEECKAEKATTARDAAIAQQRKVLDK